jgi:FkbM family methyltransferase
VLRVFLWQFGTRFLKMPVVVPWVNDTRLVIEKGMTGASGNIYCGLHECHDMAFVLHFLQPGDLFVDVGANVGSYTILASGATGAQTICFEPVPQTFQHLLDNIYLNRLGGTVSAHNVAVGAKVGQVEMISDQDTVNRVVPRGESYSGAKVIVPVITLDEVLAGRVPKMIKIDVEGFESQVMQGAARTLENLSLEAVLIELNGSGETYGFDESKLHLRMIELGFSKCSYNAMTRELRDGDDEDWYTGNSLYVRNRPMVQRLLFSAKRFSVIGKQI